MNAIILLFACSFVALVSANTAEEDRKRFFKYTKECNDDPATHVDKEILKKLLKREHVDYTPQLGAHFLCVNKKIGSIKGDGTVNTEIIRKLLQGTLGESNPDIEQIITRCVVTKETVEETSYYMTACLRKALPQPPPPTKDLPANK